MASLPRAKTQTRRLPRPRSHRERRLPRPVPSAPTDRSKDVEGVGTDVDEWYSSNCVQRKASYAESPPKKDGGIHTTPSFLLDLEGNRHCGGFAPSKLESTAQMKKVLDLQAPRAGRCQPLGPPSPIERTVQASKALRVGCLHSRKRHRTEDKAPRQFGVVPPSFEGGPKRDRGRGRWKTPVVRYQKIEVYYSLVCRHP